RAPRQMDQEQESGQRRVWPLRSPPNERALVPPQRNSDVPGQDQIDASAATWVVNIGSIEGQRGPVRRRQHQRHLVPRLYVLSGNPDSCRRYSWSEVERGFQPKRLLRDTRDRDLFGLRPLV